MIHHEGVVQGWSILLGLELEFGIGSGLEWGFGSGIETGLELSKLFGLKIGVRIGVRVGVKVWVRIWVSCNHDGFRTGEWLVVLG